MKIFSGLLDKLSGALNEVNSRNWSLTKFGILVFMYPAITYAFIYDLMYYNRMDVTNSLIFITGVVTPRFISQILAARLGTVKKGKQR